MGFGEGGKLIIKLKKRLWPKDVCFIATDRYEGQIWVSSYGRQPELSLCGAEDEEEPTPILTVLVAGEAMMRKLDDLASGQTVSGSAAGPGTQTQTDDALLAFLDEDLVPYLFGGRVGMETEAAEEGEPRVAGAIWMNWVKEPFVHGLYSFPHVDGVMADREVLARPEWNDSKDRCHHLFFAGEATERVNYASIHGALDSGRRAAGEVMQSLES